MTQQVEPSVTENAAASDLPCLNMAFIHDLGKVKFKDKHRVQWDCVYIWIIAISP